MTSLTDSWAQDVAVDIRIPAISPPVVRHLLPVIEMQIRKIIQQAHKFQKRGKSRCLTVEDINLALSLNGLEEIYGLCPPTPLGSSSSGPTGNASNIVNLLTFAKRPLGKCPLLPELSLHWLAVEGYQPLIPENPSTATIIQPSDNTESTDQPLSLPKEIQHFYYRTTGLILSCDHTTLPVVLEALRSDMGLQDLVPYFSKFIYQQVRASTKSLSLLKALIDTVGALLNNNALRMEFHLQQLLPAVFTCIVASRLASNSEDHWSLRVSASQIVALICRKYTELFPDFQARFCKTYVDALTLSLTIVKGKEGKEGREGKEGKDGKDNKDKNNEKENEKNISSLATMYGGIVGLQSLGPSVVRSLLLPRVQGLLERIDGLDPKKIRQMKMGGTVGVGGSMGGIGSSSGGGVGVGGGSSGGVGGGGGSGSGWGGVFSVGMREREVAAEKCRTVLLHALGTYMVSRLRLPVTLKIEDTLWKEKPIISSNNTNNINNSTNNSTNNGTNSNDSNTSNTANKVNKPNKKRRTEEPIGPNIGLEEALVPYYATASKDLYYCRLFI